MTVLYFLLFILVFALLILSLFYVRETNRTKYYRELLIKILNNDDLIKESLATVAAAYNIEEGDILEFISKRSKQK